MPGSEARQPRLAVTLNGQIVDSVFSAEIESNGFLCADRFSLNAAFSSSNAAQWSGAPLQVEIQLGTDGQWTSLITGNADEVAIDPIHATVALCGRDLTALFIDSQIDQSFENQTSSNIVTALANRHGLQASVTPTQALIGRYYQSGRTRTTLAQHARATTQWDLLCWLAQIEGFDIWMTGGTVNFQPSGGSNSALSIAPTDCINLQMRHALDIAGGVSVTVKSWDSVAQNAVVQSASNGLYNANTSRTLIRPNLSSDEAKGLATRLVSQISSHERTVNFDMPGDVSTAPRSIMTLSGTGTDFDGQYRISSVGRRISFTGGFTQSIEARSIAWTAS